MHVYIILTSFDELSKENKKKILLCSHLLISYYCIFTACTGTSNQIYSMMYYSKSIVTETVTISAVAEIGCTVRSVIRYVAF